MACAFWTHFVVAETDLAERVQISGIPAGKELQKASLWFDPPLHYESGILGKRAGTADTALLTNSHSAITD